MQIRSKTWTETEVTGFGIYQYVNSPIFTYNTGLKDGKWTVTFVNKGSESIMANCYADEVLMIKDLEIPAGEARTGSFINCSIHEETSLQFFVSDSAVTEEEACEKYLCISDISYNEVKRTGDDNKDKLRKSTIFLASDSTVQSYEEFYYPQTGWGQVFVKYVCPKEDLIDYQAEDHCYPQCHVYERRSVYVENRSIGARSARSFIDEGKWNSLLLRAKAGDYVLLQWAHNDATAVRPNRYVCPEESFGEYRDVMLKVASREKVPCVDLCTLSNNYLKEIGGEEAKSLYLWCPAGAYPESAYADGVSDNTHLQEYGAEVYARMVAQALIAMNGFPEIEALKLYLDITYVPEKRTVSMVEKPVDLKVPSSFALQELNINDKKANFLLIWNDVEGAVSYNVYRKGSVDFQFFPLRSVSAEEKKTSAVLPFILPAADVYQVKVTAVFADGKESNPSRIIEFRA